MDMQDKLIIEQRRERERHAVDAARRAQKAVTYVDTDGCEVTVTPSGNVFYNAADWW